MSRKRRKRGNPLKTVLIILILLIIVAGGITAFMLITGKGANSNPVAKQINREVSKKAVEKYVSNETGMDVDINEIEDSMSEEDADTFNEIMDKYSESGLVSDALSIYRENGGDMAATAAELKDKINPEDMETIKELYQKYGSSIPIN